MRKGLWDVAHRAMALALQWGRNLFVAESGWARRLFEIETKLQWGRNLFVAESW